MTWLEFKSFLRKNLRDSRAFVDNLWSKLKRDSQYQSESVLDWASHLEHLQSILLEFDADGAPGEPTMIRYFREGLKPSIQAEMEQRGRELDNFKDTIQKTVDAETKAALRPRSAARETDQHCPRGTRPAKSQGSPMKDPRIEEPKARTQETTFPYHHESSETSVPKAWRRKRRNTVVSRLEKILDPPQPLVSIRLKPVESSAKTRARSAATIAPKRDIIQGIVPYPGRTRQKTSSGLGDLHVDYLLE